MSGFFLVHRDIFDNPLLRDGERFRAWLWLVSEACWKPTKFDIRGTVVEIQRGQICASRDQLAKAWKWSPSAVERFLTRLETEQMIGRETGQGRTIITICNYSKYQDQPEQTGQPTGQPTGQQSDSHRTAKEQGNKGTIEEEEPIGPSSSARARNPDQGDLLEDQPETPASPAKPKRPLNGPHALPDDWEPSLGPKRAAMVSTWPDGMFEHQLSRFRIHARRNERLANNWNLAFGTWIDRANQGRTQYGNSGQHFGGQDSRAVSAGTWPERDHRDGFQRSLDRELGLDRPAEPASASGRQGDGQLAGHPRLSGASR